MKAMVPVDDRLLAVPKVTVDMVRVTALPSIDPVRVQLFAEVLTNCSNNSRELPMESKIAIDAGFGPHLVVASTTRDALFGECVDLRRNLGCRLRHAEQPGQDHLRVDVHTR